MILVAAPVEEGNSSRAETFSRGIRGTRFHKTNYVSPSYVLYWYVSQKTNHFPAQPLANAPNRVFCPALFAAPNVFFQGGTEAMFLHEEFILIHFYVEFAQNVEQFLVLPLVASSFVGKKTS